MEIRLPYHYSLPPSLPPSLRPLYRTWCFFNARASVDSSRFWMVSRLDPSVATRDRTRATLSAYSEKLGCAFSLSSKLSIALGATGGRVEAWWWWECGRVVVACSVCVRSVVCAVLCVVCAQ